MWIMAHAGFASAVFAAGVRLSKESWDEKRKATAFRWFLLGSLLPDLVDKPLGKVIFGGYFQNGRIFFHTLLVLSLFLAVGVILWRKGDIRVISLAAGMAVHLLLDGLWTFPETAFWPLLGPFPRFPEKGSLWKYLVEQLKDPLVLFTELSGLVALVLSLRAMGYSSTRKAIGLFLPVSRRK
ncbi:MAG: metal-dependent hydrolase [Candidatus Geothermincolales bacterium]